MNKISKIISGFLGISMFMFGILKFVNPFKGWYITQVETSELPFQTLSYWLGQFGEIIIGLLFLWLIFKGSSLNRGQFLQLFTLANLATVVMMLVAVYVHLHPDVPHEVLPLKIKPPVIPVIFGVLPVINWLIYRFKLSPSNT